MKKYLDPKADLTFKKIFGEHEDLLISLINALLPLKEDEQVESVEYLTPELAPDNYVGKNSIVDVRCKDIKGRQFLVEMQMLWTPAFQQRVLFNASKAFVRQLDRNRKFELLQPVYSLNLVNETFMNDYPDEFIHNFNIVHDLHDDKIIEGLHFTFIELPKFQPQSIKERKMADSSTLSNALQVCGLLSKSCGTCEVFSSISVRNLSHNTAIFLSLID